MSVHSLIDRFDQQSSGGVGTLAAAAAAAAAEESVAKSGSGSEETLTTTQPKPTIQPLVSEPILPTIRSLTSSPNRSETPKQNLGSLGSILGPELSDVLYSEGALIEAIRLRIEQEKTQQEAYRNEIASKNLDILQTALRAQVPVQLIPQMCVSSSLIAEQNQLQQLQTMYASSVHPQHHQQRLLLIASQTSTSSSSQVVNQMPPGQAQAQAHHLQHGYQHQPQGSFSQSYGPQFASQQKVPNTGLLPPGHYSGGERNARGYPVTSLARPDTLSASSVPPLNYRFGGPSMPSTSASTMSSPSYLTSRRPLSPAKIGAQAVANLNMPPTTPSKRSASSLYLHQRHYSMPVDTSSTESPLGQTQSITPQRGNKASSSTKKNQQQGGVGPTSSSLSGTTARIQVNPLPAQPLHKQKKLGQPPSQESMTSLSHIIQFHHWKPENPGSSSGSSNIPTVMGSGATPIISTGTSTSTPGPSPRLGPNRNHKRHKLESMSIDVGSRAPSKLTTPDENTSDHDLTLDDDTDTSRLAEPPTEPQSR
ncbi:uncharacterized protein KQ657_002073 [Scheffersomyces spartinae]|uniref:Uncharacterized protein n=1 Tax=Scheffersomyces spartinae TaxID=45513 RepID=A0A9P8AKA4_9ASCO|nr:uncharacterized protein KQ657_002073 [Scheffersomyces spartinae]KAG7195692.1 hypothetical protein KQ657_002073 [Scheffersomyces spartinae]